MCIIPDADFVTYILYGLGSQYGSFCFAFSMHIELMSSDELLGLLLQEEQRIDDDTLAMSSPTANAAYRKSGGRSTPAPATRTEFGSGSVEDAAAVKPRLPCHICKRTGHDALNCFNRLNLRQFLATNRNVATRLQKSDKSALLATPNNSSDIIDPWYLDSGASHHVTAYVGNLSLQSNYNGTYPTPKNT